ncbi:MAG: MlaD family protein [Bacteroidota bacterium]|nr:MlaD family protein [Bacteroidota bacterium]
MFDKSRTYYVVYDHAEQLEESSPVFTRGFKVGSVVKVGLDPQNPYKVLVTLDVDNEIALPKETKAILMSTGLLGGKAIELKFDHHCTNDCLPDKAFLIAGTSSLLTSMIPEVNSDDVHDMIKNIKTVLENLSSTTKQLNNLLSESSKNLNGSLKNINTLTSALANNAQVINRSLTNIESITKGINQSNPGHLIKSAEAAMAEGKKTIQELGQVVDQSQKSIGQLNNVLTQINSGQGSLGKLIQDPTLYKNLEKTSKNLNLLFQDIRLNPQRYIQLSVFKGKKDPIVSPQEE